MLLIINHTTKYKGEKSGTKLDKIDCTRMQTRTPSKWQHHTNWHPSF